MLPKYTLLLVLLLSFSVQLQAQYDPELETVHPPHPEEETYHWKRGFMKNNVGNALAACNRSLDLLDRYIHFCRLASKGTTMQYRQIKEFQELDILGFKAAMQQFKRALHIYENEARPMLVKAKKRYQHLGKVVGGARDQNLNHQRKMSKNVMREARTIYRNALKKMTLGNRHFNAGNVAFNGGVDEHSRRKADEEEALPKRRAFHRWPASN